MSTLSQNTGLPPSPAAPAVDYADSRLPSSLAGEPLYAGLALATWLKIGVIAALMLLLFRFNVARLWAKTNPFTAQDDNWQHSFLLPFIGLYYLYVWRESILKPATKVEPAPSRWDWAGAWGVFSLFGIAAALCVAATVPDLAKARAGSIVGFPIPLPLLLVGIAVAGAAVPAFAYRNRFPVPAVGRRLDVTVRMLRTWLMLTVILWGMGFFVAAASLDVFLKFAAPILGVVSLGLLAAIFPLSNSANAAARSAALNQGSASWFGGYLMVFGILFSMWGIYPGQNDFFKDLGMMMALFGVVTLTAGWHLMSIAWFPIALLLCGIPWPDQHYSAVALPLQNLAARVAVKVLNSTGVEAAQQGTKILMLGHGNVVRTLDVAQACAGMKSLMTFVSIATTLAFFSSRPLWQKAIVCASAVPIAIFCNVMRVSGQGLLDFYVSESWSTGFAHGFAGLVMLIPGFFLLLLVGWVLDRVFVEVADDAEQPAKQKPAVVVATRTPATAPASVAPAAKPAVSVPAKTPATIRPAPAPAAAAPTTAPASQQPKVIQVPRRSLAPGVKAAPAAPAQPKPPARPAANPSSMPGRTEENPS